MSYNLATQSDLANQTARAATALRYRPPTQQEAAQASAQTEVSQTTALEWEGDKLATPDIETDVAVLTSTVSLAEAEAYPSVSIFGVPMPQIKAEDLIAAYRTAYRGSRSHNLMLERFMQGVVANGLLWGLSVLGVKPEEIANIQAQVREEALAEIDNRIAVDWAYAKATMDILS